VHVFFRRSSAAEPDERTGDETHPTCKACEKKDRPCQWEAPHARFKDYQPESSSSKSPMERERNAEPTGVEGVARSEGSDSRITSPRRINRRTGTSPEGASDSGPSPSLPDPFLHGSLFHRLGAKRTRTVSTHVPEGMSEDVRAYSTTPKPLTHHEALLVHHYTEYLGRWLDCTDASRQFTLSVSEKRCITLLIDRLNEDAASHDETLLCAIVILRFYEQLNVSSSTGLDDEKHLAGCSAIIRTSQGHHFVDPSAPTLREAAFWVHVRQCLYSATINQQPLDIDFSLQLNPNPNSMRDSHPLARLRLETAWSNQMVWLTACVVNFCFEAVDPSSERACRPQKWQKLWDLVHAWVNERPQAFNAIFEGDASDSSAFREIWFTADWHVIAFISYQFSCIMLLSHKPGPKFAIRNVGTLSEIDRQILSHAGAICGASKSSPETVPSSIMLCHTIFIWAPLVTKPKEQEEILQLLSDFEEANLWPTAWIISAMKIQWGMDQWPVLGTQPSLSP